MEKREWTVPVPAENLDANRGIAALTPQWEQREDFHGASNIQVFSRFK